MKTYYVQVENVLLTIEDHTDYFIGNYFVKGLTRNIALNSSNTSGKVKSFSAAQKWCFDRLPSEITEGLDWNLVP